MTPHNITVMLLSVGLLLGVARAAGELVQRFRQPAIFGELLAGVLLGPTILGNISPELSAWLFPTEGPNAIALSAITNLSVVLFLLVAGMEVDLSTVRRQGSISPKVSITGIIIPFSLGALVAWLLPKAMGQHVGADPATFVLFFATAMSISALPVIAKTLMDMDLYRSDLGMVIVSAAVVDDLVGWLIFTIILSMMSAASGQATHLGWTIALTLVFAGTMLTLGRRLIHKTLPFLQAYTQWPAGVLGFALTLALLGAAFTEFIGIHAVFGAFLVGVAIGDSPRLRERTRLTVEHFVTFIFAPLFFASIGLKVNFLTHFDTALVLTVLGIACVCKLLGGMLGAKWGGMSTRDAWAVGFAMNSRGAMEIILGLLALEAGIIKERLFVALVIMAIVTSMISAPAMRMILRPAKKRRLSEFLSAKYFLPEIQSDSRRQVIKEMTLVAADATGIDAAEIENAVWAREETLSTGLGHSVALPHARLDGLRKPLVVVGISVSGVDFDAPDDKLANLIFLVLTPRDDHDSQLELTSAVVRLTRSPRLVERVLRIENFVDFLALINSIPSETEPA